MELRPAKEVVILKDAGKQKTKSGLEVPIQSGRHKPEVGVVLAIGSGKKPVEFQKGDKIIFKKYMENRIFIGDQEYNFIPFEDIMAVVNDEKANV